MTLFSCTKYDGNEEYIVTPCRVEIKAGSTFELCTKFLKPIEKLTFEENTILSGSRVDYRSESNKYSYRVVKISPFLFIFHHLTYIRKSLYYSAF